MKQLSLTAAIVLIGASAALAGEIRDRLRALTAKERNAALGGIIRSAEYSCQQPLRSRYRGTGAGRLIYVVTCEKGYSYVVSIRDDDSGATKVMDCEMAMSLGIDCSGK